MKLARGCAWKRTVSVYLLQRDGLPVKSVDACMHGTRIYCDEDYTLTQTHSERERETEGLEGFCLLSLHVYDPYKEIRRLHPRQREDSCIVCIHKLSCLARLSIQGRQTHTGRETHEVHAQKLSACCCSVDLNLCLSIHLCRDVYTNLQRDEEEEKERRRRR